VLARVLSSRDVAIAATGYVLASTTLVSDLQGWLGHGAGFGWALLAAFALNLVLCLSVAELVSCFPRAGAIYAFTASVLAPLRSHRRLGVFTAVILIGTTALAGGGEISSGAFSLAALLGTEADVRWLVAAMVVGALLPGLLDLRVTARVALAAVALMVGLRWLFGLVGLLGLGQSGPWSLAKLTSHGGGATWPALTGGFGLAFWTFVGVEAVAPFAEETRQAAALARGMIAALLLVLATSVVMGIGIAGSIGAEEWRALSGSAVACGGECPHIAVGQAMLGLPGRLLMAAAAVASCYGTVMIGIAGVARVLFALARDEGLLAGLIPHLARATDDGRPPPAALVTAAFVVVLPPLFARQVIPWLLPAALVWVLLYVLYHLLVVIDRRLAPGRARPFRLPGWLPIAGAAATAAVVPGLFLQVEAMGLVGRAAAVVATAAVLTWLVRRGPRAQT
jgi:amino acid transporter